jgi:hypothetical protein
MSYTVTHSDGTLYRVINEGEIDLSLGGTNSGIALIGQNVHNYGEIIANNFLRLLEHQSSGIAPNNPQPGQLWWDSNKKILHFFDGEKFKSCSSSDVSFNPPLRPLDGDQWWDLGNHQLNVFDGTTWIVIGPGFKKGQNFSGLEVVSVTDTSGLTHIVVVEKVDGIAVNIANKDTEFVMTTPIDGITYVGKGLTLAPNNVVSGTATNSNMLGGVAASGYIKYSTPVITLPGSLHVNGAGGIQISNGLSINSTSIINNNGHLSLSSGGSIITVDGASNTILLSKEPTIPASATTKLYVDNSDATVEANAKAYTDSRFSATINGSPISTLKDLSAAINNDMFYHVNVDANFGFKANIQSPILTGNPRAPTLPATDSSESIATTRHVKHAIDGTGIIFTDTNTTLASPTPGHVLSFNGTKWVNSVPLASGNGTTRVSLTGAVRGDTGVVSYTNSVLSVSIPTTLGPPSSTGGTTTYFKTEVNNEGRVVSGVTTGMPWADITGQPASIAQYSAVTGGLVAKSQTEVRALTLTGTTGQISIANPSGITTNGVLTNPVFSLADTTVTPGDYGNVQRMSVDGKGRITAIVAAPFDPSNPLMTSKVYDIRNTLAWWFSGTNVGMIQWDGSMANFYNSFVNISSPSYRNHPLYNASGYYGMYYYASTIAAQTQYEFTPLQPTRVVFDTSTEISISSGATFSNAYYYRIDRYNTVNNTWIPVENTDDGSWNRVTKADGSFNGYLSVAASFSNGSSASSVRAFTLTVPNDYALQAYNVGGSTNSTYSSYVLPPLPADAKYRMITQVYCVANSPAASLSVLLQRSAYTIKGE